MGFVSAHIYSSVSGTVKSIEKRRNVQGMMVDSIVIENDRTSYFFTERLTNCFLAMTVPIYFGATRIGEFFNEDGIIFIRPDDDLRKVLSQCNKRDYEARLPAILDNFTRAKKYMNIWDMMYEKYFAKGKACNA